MQSLPKKLLKGIEFHLLFKYSCVMLLVANKNFPEVCRQVTKQVVKYWPNHWVTKAFWNGSVREKYQKTSSNCTFPLILEHFYLDNCLTLPKNELWGGRFKYIYLYIPFYIPSIFLSIKRNDSDEKPHRSFAWYWTLEVLKSHK